MRFILVIFLVLVAGDAFAQATVPTTAQLPTASCNGTPTTWDGTKFSCVPWQGGTGGLTAGACLNITSGVIALNTVPVTKAVGYAFQPSDNCGTFVYNSASPGTFTFGVAGSASFPKGWGVILKVRGAGALTLAAGSPMWGCPAVYNKNQDVIVQADDTGAWALMSCLSAVPNPNAFQ